MKNVVKIALICIVVIASLLIPTVSNAATADGCTLVLDYASRIIAGQTTIATSTLKTDADFSGYNKVRVNFEVDGPADPTIYATDALGQRIDVMKYKYWGPAEGFPLIADYNESTDFEATFPVPGTYTIKLSLVDMEKAQAEILSETYTFNVGVRVTTVIGEDSANFVTNGINSFDSLAIPEPKKDGYVFAGWYTDAEFTTPLDTTKELTENTTVYAKFVPAEGQTDGEEDSNTTKDNTAAEEEKGEKGEKDETPKTGVVNYAGIAVLVIAISAATLFVIRKNRI